jgi:hypothetical protein
MMQNGDGKNDELDNLVYQIKNRHWLRHSQQIGINILICMDVLKMSKEDLSRESGIDIEIMIKMLQGRYDYSILEISKLSSILKIDLLKLSTKED